MTFPIFCTIGGADYSQYLKGLSCTPAGPGQVATATLYLTKQAGGLTILNKSVVKVWQAFDGTGVGVAPRGRYFGGFIDVREEGNVGTTEIWTLPAVSFQAGLRPTVRDAAPVNAISVTAGTFAAQVLQITQVVQRNGLGVVALEIDAVSQVADLHATMPAWIAPPGKSLEFYYNELCRLARIEDTALRPAYFLDTGRTFGVGDTFGGPVLHFYDAAILPTPIYVFSDTPTGAEKSIYGELTRTLESQAMVQRRQAVFGEGSVATYQNVTSADAYPNPLINHGRPGNAGYWMMEAVDDTTSLTFAEAEAALAIQVQPVEYPRERVVLPEVYDIVLPGEVVTVEHSLHVQTPTDYRVAEASFDFSDPTQIVQSLTLGTRRRELLDEAEEASGAQPREGDPIGPEAPGAPAETSDVYDPVTGHTTVEWEFTPSPSADTVSYQAVIVLADTGQQVGPYDLEWELGDPVPITYAYAFLPGALYKTKVRGIDASGNIGTYSTQLIASASGETLPAAPTGLAVDASGVTRSGTAWRRLTYTASTYTPVVRYEFEMWETLDPFYLQTFYSDGARTKVLAPESTVGVEYSIRARTETVGGRVGPWSATITHTVGGIIDPPPGVSLLDRARLAPGFRNLGSLTSNAFREADIVWDGTDYHVFSTHIYETENTAHRSASTPEGIVGATPTTAIAPVKYPTVVLDDSTWHLWGTITSPVGTVHYTASAPDGPYTFSDTVTIALIDMSIRKHPTNGYWYGVGFANGTDTAMQLVRAESPAGPWTDLGDVFADAGEPGWASYSRPDPTLAFTGGRSYLLFGGFPAAGLHLGFGMIELNIDTARVKGSAIMHYSEKDAWQPGNGLNDHTFLAVEGQPDRIFGFVNANAAGDFPWGVMELPEYPALEDGRRHDDVVRLDMARGFDLAANLRPVTRANAVWRPEGIEITSLGGVDHGAHGYVTVGNLTDFTMLAAFTPSAVTASATNIVGEVCVETSGLFAGRIHIHIDSTGKIAAKVQGANGTTTTLTSAITAVAGTRYDVVFRKQGDEVKLWINGVLADTDTHAASSVLTGLYYWSVGAEIYVDDDSRLPFLGTIHAFNVVGAALPPSSTLYYPPPPRHEFDIETYPFKWYDAVPNNRGQLQYLTATDRVRFTAVNAASAATEFLLEADTSVQHTLKPALGHLFKGGARYPYHTFVATGTVTLDYSHMFVTIDTNGAARTVALPAAASHTGRYYNVTKIDSSANKVTINPNASELIGGATTRKLYKQHDSIGFVSTGAAWIIVEQTGTPLFYNGTNWIGPEKEISWTYRFPTIPPYKLADSPAIIAHYMFEVGETLYASRLALVTQVVTTNTASHYWEVHLAQSIDGVTIVQFDTSADSPDVWAPQTTITDFLGQNPFIESTIQGFDIIAVAQGVPGDLFPHFKLVVHDIYT